MNKDNTSKLKLLLDDPVSFLKWPEEAISYDKIINKPKIPTALSDLKNDLNLDYIKNIYSTFPDSLKKFTTRITKGKTNNKIQLNQFKKRYYILGFLASTKVQL